MKTDTLAQKLQIATHTGDDLSWLGAGNHVENKPPETHEHRGFSGVWLLCGIETSNKETADKQLSADRSFSLNYM